MLVGSPTHSAGLCDSDSNDSLLYGRYVFPSPRRDHKGRRVIIYRPGVFDPHKQTNEDMLRIHAITVETLLENEEDQVPSTSFKAF